MQLVSWSSTEVDFDLVINGQHSSTAWETKIEYCTALRQHDLSASNLSQELYNLENKAPPSIIIWPHLKENLSFGS